MDGAIPPHTSTDEEVPPQSLPSFAEFLSVSLWDC